MSEWLKLRPKEGASMQLFHAAQVIVPDVFLPLKTRLELCGMADGYQEHADWLKDVFEALLGTIEPRRRALFCDNLARQEMRVVNKHTIDCKPDQFLVYRDALMLFVWHAVKNECATCDGTELERRKCHLRKACRETFMHDWDETDWHCIGQQVWEALAKEAGE